MSFKLFDIKFDGKKDSFEDGSKKMDEVCKIIGEKFLKEWFEYWIEKGKVERGNVKDYYKCMKVLEKCDFRNLREDI
tara:strand:+ start:351 stop:581 length:231 start_codon:yes stop_codon:yes gene_type:complete